MISRRRPRSLGRELPRWITADDDTSLARLVTRALGDPTAMVVPPDAASVDPGRAKRQIVFADRVVAHLVFDPALEQHPATVDATVAALELVLGRRLLLEETAEQEVRLAKAVERANRSAASRKVALIDDVERLKTAFATFVDPTLAEEVLMSGVRLAGREASVTVMFLGVSHSGTQGTRTAAESFDRLNQLWQTVAPIITEGGGHTNKFLNDGLLAVFGAPRETPNHAAAAVRAAIAVIEPLRRQLPKWPGVSIGLNSGQVMTGSVGGGGHVEFGIVGDVVNTAKRVQQAAAARGVDLLLTEATSRLLPPSFELTSQRAVTAHGKSLPIKVATIGDRRRSPRFVAQSS